MHPQKHRVTAPKRCFWIGRRPLPLGCHNPQCLKLWKAVGGRGTGTGRWEGTRRKSWSQAALQPRDSVFLARDASFCLGDIPSQVRKCYRKTVSLLCGAVPGLALSWTAQHGCSMVLEMCPDTQSTKHSGGSEKERWWINGLETRAPCRTYWGFYC